MAPSPQETQGDASRQKPRVAQSNYGNEANLHLSNPVPQASPFVAFNAVVSKEDRKAVRVQAARASAAARKATIARKQAKHKQESGEPAATSLPAPPFNQPIEFAEVQTGGGRGKRKRTSPQSSAWKQQTNRFRGVRHAIAGAREPRAVTQGEGEPLQEISRGLASHGKDSRAVSFFDQLTPEEPQAVVAALPHGYWQQTPQAQPEGESLPQFRAWPPRQEQPEQKPSDRNIDTVDVELPMTPVSMASLPSPSRVGLAYADPFNCYPVPYRPIYDGLLHHMLTVFAPRGWPALKITPQEGLDWEHFMTQHALAEPALFFVRLLFASGDMIHLGVLKPEVSLWLQAEAIKTINEALARPDRATSDGLILAVGRIALHESMYGDREAASIMHRPAQRRMIDLRGGMKALEMPLLVKRLMRWADRVMSVQSGTERLLPDDEDQGNHSFTTAQSVDVLERWVPQEGRSMRKKIAISDLLSD